MAGRTGLEPATSGVTGRHSNQLNYRPAALLHTWNKTAPLYGHITYQKLLIDKMVGDDGIEPPTRCL